MTDRRTYTHSTTRNTSSSRRTPDSRRTTSSQRTSQRPHAANATRERTAPRTTRVANTTRTASDARSMRERRPAGESSRQRATTRSSRSQTRPSSRRNTGCAWPALFGIDIRLIAAGIVILILIILGLRSCAGCTSSSAESSSSTPQVSVVAESSASTETTEDTSVDWDTAVDQLYSILDAEYADTLVQAAESSEDVKWIIQHIDAYAVDGSMVQYKLLKLAAKEPAARDFVRQFPVQYPADMGQACDAVSAGSVPLLQQWDMRWGYTLYCNTTFALTGCCPTALAMVYQGLTGKSDMTPYDMGALAEERGYMDAYNGTSAAFLTDCAAELGLSCWTLDVSSDSLTSALSSGAVVICNVGPGDFTTTGHYIVLCGLDDSGAVIVNDPFSAENSAHTWDVGTLISQTQGLYAYSLA